MPIDPNATPETSALYDFLRRSAPGPTLFGHQDALAYGVSWKGFHEFRTDVHDVSGHHPAVFGWDIGKISPRPSNLDLVNFRHMRFWMREVYRRGGINTVSWHANNFMGGDAWAVGTPTVAAILPGGSHHQAYRDKLELIAGFLRKVTSGPPDYTPIPIIFRPFHEHTGSWFWWGKPYASAAQYKALWRFTVAYLRDEQGLHHLLWCYSTDIVDDEAEYLASSTYQRVLGILTGRRGQLPPPVKDFMQGLHPQEQAAIADFLAVAVIGGPDTVREGLASLAQVTQADEFMLVSDVFDPALRLRSMTLTAEAMGARQPIADPA